MGAPMGNCNAAKNKSACKAGKGWYGKSGSRKYLGKAMGSYKRKVRDWYVGSTPFKERKAKWSDYSR